VPAPLEFWLPSEKPGGNAINDRIWVAFYSPAIASGVRVPAVVLLHYLGSSGSAEMRAFARYLAARGIAAAVMTLPYHAKRLPPADSPVNHFVPTRPETAVQAYGQSASDVSTVVTWLVRRPDVDSKRIGIAGISLGAIVTHLAMGLDERLSAGVAMLGGGDLPEIYRDSVVGRYVFGADPSLLNEVAILQLRAVDPLTYANRNRPRRVLMIQAARDSFIPSRAAERLWQALGRPPIQWIDTNHPALALVPRQAMRTTLSYLQSVWNAPAGESSTRIDGKGVPRIWVSTIKAGTIFGLDSVATPAIQLQVLSFAARRDHMSLLHADIGISGRGPFVGLAATVNQYIDAGVARRLGGRRIRPYLSVHIVF
jgi:dienelactone hydrolase